MQAIPDELRYVSEDKLSPDEIKAGLANQSLKPWRIDANGKRWFERKVILALPVTAKADLADLGGAGVIRAVPEGRKEKV